jgi:hypothetical protein
MLLGMNNDDLNDQSRMRRGFAFSTLAVAALLAVSASAAEARGGNGGGHGGGHGGGGVKFGSVAEGRAIHERGHVTSRVPLIPHQRITPPSQTPPKGGPVLGRGHTLHPKVPLIDTRKPTIYSRIPLINVHKPPIKHPPIDCHTINCGSYGHHAHGGWSYGGTAVLSAGYGNCAYEYSRWQSGGSAYWKARYLACQAS